MRRRSERKKSTDVSSPAPASRRTSRRSRKSPSFSENENNVEESPAHVAPNRHDFDDNVRASSEERTSKPVRRTGTRTSRKRSPITSPIKKRNQRADSGEIKVEPIPEEEDKEIPSKVEKEDDPADQCVTEETSMEDNSKLSERKQECSSENETLVQEKESVLKSETAKQEKTISMLVETEIDKGYQSENVRSNDKYKMLESNSVEINDKEEIVEVPHITTNEVFGIAHESDKLDKKCENDFSKFPQTEFERNEADRTETREMELQKVEGVAASSGIESDNHIKKRKLITRTSAVGNDNNYISNRSESNKNIRKHKWVSKNKEPTLAISSDSLKSIIDDVHLVPLSDVKLECSSESEETASEREEGENSPTPERNVRQISNDKNEKGSKRPFLETGNNMATDIINQQMLANTNSQILTNNSKTIMNKSPSPAKNQKSSILYITNLVRPFTVLQLKGLLARTGKIVEDGFWIDRIKSKCYVQYETSDEAIETRHALHGVRWPVSNPKCLHVEFGSGDDMQRAIQSTKEDAPKFGQENTKDNVIIGTGWTREHIEIDEKKTTKPVREWDVGKKESSEREKKGEKERSRERERDRDRDREDKTGRGRDLSTGNRENAKDRKQRLHARDRSHSHSPARKLKKQENEPPLRLLDDLFRKTKAAPCIYWLPLTPEQIAEKEAFRLKRIEEHKERVKLRELEREKERVKERDRYRNNERERETRRNRSIDRRRSRSRERRRY